MARIGKRKRSIHGGGSISHRKDGRWQARFKVEETGKYKYLYAATEKEVTKKLQDALLQQKQGTLATGPQQTVKQFLEYWLENVQKPTVRLSTYLNNQRVIHIHLIPGLGNHKLQKLMAQHVQSFYAKKQKEGASPSYIRKFQAVLHKALAHAKRMKLVGSNVTEDVVLPRYEQYAAPVLTPEQALVLLASARERGLETLLALAVSTGMRIGEILALRWSDVDLFEGTLRISRTLSYLPKGYRFVEGKPKTRSSERAIRLPHFLLDLLKAHNILEAKRKLLAGEAWVDRDLVFSNKVGDFIVPKTLRLHFHHLLEAAGLPHMRFHDLRHSAATILISKGVPANMVQELLGHSNVAITLGVYGSVVPSMRKDAADKMDNLLGEKASALSEKFEGYSSGTRKCLEALMSNYGEGAVQLALEAIRQL